MLELEATVSLAITVIVSFLLTGLATAYSRRHGLLDLPGPRQSHSVATPRGGGAGPVVTLLIYSLVDPSGALPGLWLSCLLPGLTVLSLLGWWDDHRPLSARFRFFVQLIVSLSTLWYLTHLGLITGVVPAALAGLFLLWMTNLYNFMDGSNGMAGLQGVFGGTVLAGLFHVSGETGLALISSVLAACCIGFLPWNLGRARVFMGDVGSLTLGFAFASLIICGVSLDAFSLPVAMLIMLVFLCDSTLTLVVRVMNRERWYTAHRKHLYQRLIAHGWTHGRVAMLYQAVNLVLVLPAIAVAVSYPALAWVVALGLTLVTGSGWFLVKKRIGVLARAG